MYLDITMDGLPPVCRALASISLHLSLIESEVPGARGKVLINVLGVTSVGSLLLLELLLELLQRQQEKWHHLLKKTMKQTVCRKCINSRVQLETTCLDNEHEENVSQISELCFALLCYLSSFASGLPSEGETTGVVCSFLFSSEGFSPPPGSSRAQMI